MLPGGVVDKSKRGCCIRYRKPSPYSPRLQGRWVTMAAVQAAGGASPRGTGIPQSWTCEPLPPAQLLLHFLEREKGSEQEAPSRELG